MSSLFVERRKVRNVDAYCVTDGVRLLGACLSEAAAQELLDASLLASTLILHTPIFKPATQRHTGYGEL
jgi:hypothetical protein